MIDKEYVSPMAFLCGDLLSLGISCSYVGVCAVCSCSGDLEFLYCCVPEDPYLLSPSRSSDQCE